jgi:hypothetical protein
MNDEVNDKGRGKRQMARPTTNDEANNECGWEWGEVSMNTTTTHPHHWQQQQQQQEHGSSRSSSSSGALPPLFLLVLLVFSLSEYNWQHLVIFPSPPMFFRYYIVIVIIVIINFINFIIHILQVTVIPQVL